MSAPMDPLAPYLAATNVRAETFTPSEKWAYTVHLDYSQTAAVMTLSGYINPVKAARLALRMATERGTSGVTFSTLPEGWVMFVPDSPNGWPVMVGGAA